MPFKINFKLCPKLIGQLFIAGLLIFTVFFLTGCSINQDKNADKDDITKQPQLEQEPEPFQWQKLPITVMIENFKKARPITGILSARIIYEAPVEADITRFLAVFQKDKLPKNIGPVRSARSYFIDWAKEYGSLYIHAGGSPQALNELKNISSIYNLDEISKNGNYFFRDLNKSKPHNLYISKKSISDFIEKNNLALKNDIKGWYYKNSSNKIDTSMLGVLKIEYRENAVWKYDKDLNRYLRYENGSALFDKNNNQLNAGTIVVQKTDVKTKDAIGRKSIRTQGSGEVIVFKNGQVIKGFWEKLRGDKRTRFYKKNGEEIVFSPGIVWIHIVSKETNINYY